MYLEPQAGEPRTVVAAKLVQAYKAAHIVVGHTVQKTGRIRARFGDKIFLIDTGMLSSYYPGGRPSALEVCGNDKLVGGGGNDVIVQDPPTLLAAIKTRK